jgi:DNA-3-methyladenine glycosylase I
LKIEAAVANARAYLDLRATGTDLSRLLWSFVDGAAVDNARKRTEQVPITTPISDAMSKELKRRGFRFVGSTTIYAFMQAAGMVNDHLTSCFRYAQVREKRIGRAR